MEQGWLSSSTLPSRLRVKVPSHSPAIGSNERNATGPLAGFRDCHFHTVRPLPPRSNRTTTATTPIFTLFHVISINAPFARPDRDDSAAPECASAEVVTLATRV